MTKQETMKVDLIEIKGILRILSEDRGQAITSKKRLNELNRVLSEVLYRLD